MPVLESEKKIIEDFEDARFSMLMYYLSASSGKKLLELNERLKSDSTVIISDELDCRCRETIHREYSKHKRLRFIDGVKKYVSKIAVLLLVLNIIFLIFFSSASAFRAKVLNFVHESFGEVVDFGMTEGTEPYGNNHVKPELGWLPEGYELSDASNWTKAIYIAEYTNSEDLRVIISSYEGSSTSMSVDCMDAEINRETTVNGYQGVYIKKGTRQTVVWGDTDNDLIYKLTADSVSESDFIRILDNVKYVDIRHTVE